MNDFLKAVKAKIVQMNDSSLDGVLRWIESIESAKNLQKKCKSGAKRCKC